MYVCNSDVQISGHAPLRSSSKLGQGVLLSHSVREMVISIALRAGCWDVSGVLQHGMMHHAYDSSLHHAYSSWVSIWLFILWHVHLMLLINWHVAAIVRVHVVHVVHVHVVILLHCERDCADKAKQAGLQSASRLQVYAAGCTRCSLTIDRALPS